MKCKYCGADVGLEDLVCQHCGMPNEEARRHAQDMQRFSRDYAQTKSEVAQSARKAGRLAAHAIVLGLVVIANIIVFSLVRNAWSLQRSMQVRKAEKNYETHIRAMDEYLEGQDYLGLSAYCQASHIDGYSTVFREYELPIRMSRQYTYLYGSLAQMIFPSVYEQERAGSYHTESFYDSLDTLYKMMTPAYIEDYSYQTDTKLSFAAAEGIRRQVDGLLTAFLDLDGDQVQSLPGLSKTQRNLILEEHILAAFGNGSEGRESVQ